MAENTFTPDRSALMVLLRAPFGMVGRDILRRSQAVENVAKSNAPDGPPRQGGGPKLKDTIAADRRPVDIGTGVASNVRATARHARIVHEGTEAHDIEPRTKTVLRFTANGEVVFAKRVRHPGTTGQPFLRDALSAALR